MPALTERDFIQGGMILALIETWSDWVHRRVEYVTLSEPQTSERRISVDFTLAHDPAIAPLYGASQAETYLVPVACIEKHRMTRFSIRDEAQHALPAWTQEQTATIATAVLVEAATDVVQPPTELVGRLTADLPTPPSIPKDILTDLWFIVSAHQDEALERWQDFAAVPEGLTDEQEAESRQWRHDMIRSNAFVALANDFARSFLVITPLMGEKGSRRIVKMSFEERRQDTPIAGGRDDGLSGATAGYRLPGKLRTVIWQVQRFLGLRAKRIVLPAASIGRAQCFHLEIDVPEGIRLTHAKLRAYSAEKVISDVAQARQNNGRWVDVVTKSTQCVHLHLANVPRRLTGAGVLALRIGDGLVVRGALVNAAFTTAALIIVAVDPGAFIRDTDSAVAVLLGIPGGISLYIARSREPGMSTSMHAGIRLLALTNAVVAFGAVVLILTGGKCEVMPKTGKEACTQWSGMNLSLLVLVIVAGLMLMSLTLAYGFSRWPPELSARKKIRGGGDHVAEGGW
jgi:hypothetical protein